MKYRLLKDLPWAKAGLVFDRLEIKIIKDGETLLKYSDVYPYSKDEWFEELPESQEEKCSGCATEGLHDSFCSNPQKQEPLDICNCKDCTLVGSHNCRNNCQPQKEECKHENAKEIHNELGVRIFECPNCPDYTITSAKKFQPKQKPSEWIKERREQLNKGGFGIVQAILDFLDSHADIFNK